MSRFRSLKDGAVVSVDDAKDDRFGADWELLDQEKAPAKRAARKS